MYTCNICQRREIDLGNLRTHRLFYCFALTKTHLDWRELDGSFHFEERELGREREHIEDESLELDAVDARVRSGASNVRPRNTFPRDMIRALCFENRRSSLEKGERKELHA